MKQQQVIQKKQKIRQKTAQHIRKSQVPAQIQDHPYLQAQGIIGNHGMLRRHSGVIQAKFKISQPGDKYEWEADQVAEKVMRMPKRNVQRQSESEDEEEIVRTKPIAGQSTPLVQRLVDDEFEKEEEEKDKLIQTKGVSNQAPQVAPDVAAKINALRGGGQPLPDSTRAFFESRFGYDFSQVRIHTDSRAAKATQALNARAFTVKKDIVFGTAQYAPATNAGQRLLGHELTHVVQQAGRGLCSQHISNVQKGDILQTQTAKHGGGKKWLRIYKEQGVPTIDFPGIPLPSLLVGSRYIYRNKIYPGCWFGRFVILNVYVLGPGHPLFKFEGFQLRVSWYDFYSAAHEDRSLGSLIQHYRKQTLTKWYKRKNINVYRWLMNNTSPKEWWSNRDDPAKFVAQKFEQMSKLEGKGEKEEFEKHKGTIGLIAYRGLLKRLALHNLDKSAKEIRVLLGKDDKFFKALAESYKFAAPLKALRELETRKRYLVEIAPMVRASEYGQKLTPSEENKIKHETRVLEARIANISSNSPIQTVMLKLGLKITPKNIKEALNTIADSIRKTKAAIHTNALDIMELKHLRLGVEFKYTDVGKYTETRKIGGKTAAVHSQAKTLMTLVGVLFELILLIISPPVGILCSFLSSTIEAVKEYRRWRLLNQALQATVILPGEQTTKRPRRFVTQREVDTAKLSRDLAAFGAALSWASAFFSIGESIVVKMAKATEKMRASKVVKMAKATEKMRSAALTRAQDLPIVKNIYKRITYLREALQDAKNKIKVINEQYDRLIKLAEDYAKMASKDYPKARLVSSAMRRELLEIAKRIKANAYKLVQGKGPLFRAQVMATTLKEDLKMARQLTKYQKELADLDRKLSKLIKISQQFSDLALLLELGSKTAKEIKIKIVR